MARPPTIQKLRHDRILCGRVFRLFVETWNWLTGYVDNLRGDADVNAQNGYITIDRTNPDAPVIRLRADRLPKGGGGNAVDVPADGPFSPVYDTEGEDPEVVTGFTNCYWMNGGVTVLMSGTQTIPGTDGFVALKTGATPSTSGTATLYCYPDLSSLRSAQQDVAHYVIPLYVVDSSKIVLDLRNIPHGYTWEVVP